MLAHTKIFRAEIGRRVGTPSMTCPFGSMQWTCGVCLSEEEKGRRQLADMAEQTLRALSRMKGSGLCAPVASMLPSENESLLPGQEVCANLRAWDSAGVADAETVEVGGLRFALDMCDGTLKFMLLSK